MNDLQELPQNEESKLPFPGFVTFGINLTVFDDTLSIERCQKELKEPELSSVMVMVCYPNSKLIPKVSFENTPDVLRPRAWADGTVVSGACNPGEHLRKPHATDCSSSVSSGADYQIKNSIQLHDQSLLSLAM
jgi:hypothetical protein